MEDILMWIWGHLTGRVGGPLSLRRLMQPIVASLLAVRAGLQDAKTSRHPYMWAIFTEPSHRQELLAEGWKDITKVFVMAVVMDVVYQLVVFRWLYPNEALLAAFLLACAPYLLIRGPVNRLARPNRSLL